MRLFIVSGRSGAGKSIALGVLEDLGFYCVDNLPVELLPKLVRLSSKEYSSVAVSIDIRNLPGYGDGETCSGDPGTFSSVTFEVGDIAV